MSHLITILKCHIGKIPSKKLLKLTNYQKIGIKNVKPPEMGNLEKAGLKKIFFKIFVPHTILSSS